MESQVTALIPLIPEPYKSWFIGIVAVAATIVLFSVVWLAIVKVLETSRERLRISLQRQHLDLLKLRYEVDGLRFTHNLPISKEEEAYLKRFFGDKVVDKATTELEQPERLEALIRLDAAMMKRRKRRERLIDRVVLSAAFAFIAATFVFSTNSLYTWLLKLSSQAGMGDKPSNSLTALLIVAFAAAVLRWATDIIRMRAVSNAKSTLDQMKGQVKEDESTAQ